MRDAAWLLSVLQAGKRVRVILGPDAPPDKWGHTRFDIEHVVLDDEEISPAAARALVWDQKAARLVSRGSDFWLQLV